MMLSKEQCLSIYRQMLCSRFLDEHLISMYKKGQGYFWVGATGQEAMDVPLGLLVKKGKGVQYDWLHLHYRCTGTIVAMGADIKDIFRMMMNKNTDPFSQGKNFIHHYSIPQWNIPPITSSIETQMSWAIGTAHVQSKKLNAGISIVTGGDAGTALGDFSTSLIWSSKPVNPLPLLIIILNNQWGISTSYKSQHSETHISDRAKAFGIPTYLVNGNNVTESYFTLQKAIQEVRKTRKPVVIEAQVSRLYGHSSSSGANYMEEECCIQNFENELTKNQMLNLSEIKKIRQDIKEQLKQSVQSMASEEEPNGNIWSHIYSNNEQANWRKF